MASGEGLPADLSAAVARGGYAAFLRATPWNTDFNYGGLLLEHERVFQERIWVSPVLRGAGHREAESARRQADESALLDRIGRKGRGKGASTTLVIGDRGSGKTTLMRRFLHLNPSDVGHWCDFEESESVLDGRIEDDGNSGTDLVVNSLVNLFMTLFDPKVLRVTPKEAASFVPSFLRFAYGELRRKDHQKSAFLDASGNAGVSLEEMLDGLKEFVFEDNLTVPGYITDAQLRARLIALSAPELLRIFYAALILKVVEEGFQRTHHVVFDNVDAIHGHQRSTFIQGTIEYGVAQVFGDLANALPLRSQDIVRAADYIHTVVVIRHNRWIRDHSTTRGEGAVPYHVKVTRLFPAREVVERRHVLLMEVDPGGFGRSVEACGRVLGDPRMLERLQARTNGNLRALSDLLASISDECGPLDTPFDAAGLGRLNHAVYRHFVLDGGLRVDDTPILMGPASAPVARFVLCFLLNHLTAKDLRNIQVGLPSEPVPLPVIYSALREWNHALSIDEFGYALWVMFRREAGFVWARAIRAIGFNGDEAAEFSKKVKDGRACVSLTAAGLNLLSDGYLDFEFWNAVNSGGGGSALGLSAVSVGEEVFKRLSLILSRELATLRGRALRAIGGTAFESSDTYLKFWTVAQLEVDVDPYGVDSFLRKTGRSFSFWLVLAGSLVRYVASDSRTSQGSSALSDEWFGALRTSLGSFLSLVLELQRICPDVGFDVTTLDSLLGTESWTRATLEDLAQILPQAVVPGDAPRVDVPGGGGVGE